MRTTALVIVPLAALVGLTAVAEMPDREVRRMRGWDVLVSRALLDAEPRATARALELLDEQLAEIERVVPAAAVGRLREVPLYVNPEYAGFGPGAEYHPDAGWLLDNGRDPAMAKAIEFTNVGVFEADMQRMPNFVLHELAHAYHHRCLPDGFANADVQAAFDRAAASGVYDEVERRFGEGRPNKAERAYALTNPQEYFAETTEAFFSRNDFFPFTREELRGHDPRMFEVLARLWHAEDAPPDAETARHSVSADRMQQVYEEVKTPCKFGVVLRGERDQLVDSPSVFRNGGRWYMVYIASTGNVGYETCLARSDDLLHWEKLGKVLGFPPAGWDRWQRAGGIALCDTTWGGGCELQTFDDRYWMSFIGGALQGYETDPLAIGLAWTKTPTEAVGWTPLAENPVLSRDQPDVRAFEKQTLYRSQIILDKTKTLGSPFVMYYNGKIKSGYEKIGMAVSDDMIHWRRHGTEPVVANGEERQVGISGDPQIVKIGDLWVMFYFGAFWKPAAFDTFACSTDLVHWTKWTGPHLVEPSEPWDRQFAHKPWLVKHGGVVYHFYCAVGDQGRVIALATSKDLREASTIRAEPTRP